MLKYIINKINIVVCNEIRPDGTTDGYGASIARDLTATDILLGIFALIGFVTFIYLVIKFSIYLFNLAFYSGDDENKE